jgi:lipopolysaccharide assembly outer membrane protein LptD (OstA)
MIEFLMKKVLMAGLCVLFFSGLFLMVRTGKEFSGDLKISGGSFIEGIKILQKKNGTTVWTLTATRAHFLEDENRAELSDISMMLQKNGVVLYADKGIYNLSERSFTTSSVVKADAKDYKITADSVDYDVSSGNIKTGGRIKVEGKGFKVEGKGMESDGDKKVKILNDVTATFNK